MLSQGLGQQVVLLLLMLLPGDTAQKGRVDALSFRQGPDNGPRRGVTI